MSYSASQLASCPTRPAGPALSRCFTRTLCIATPRSADHFSPASQPASVAFVRCCRGWRAGWLGFKQQLFHAKPARPPAPPAVDEIGRYPKQGLCDGWPGWGPRCGGLGWHAETDVRSDVSLLQLAVRQVAARFGGPTCGSWASHCMYTHPSQQTEVKHRKLLSFFFFDGKKQPETWRRSRCQRTPSPLDGHAQL